MVYAIDLRSIVRKDVWVQVPPPAQTVYTFTMRNKLLLAAGAGAASILLAIWGHFIADPSSLSPSIIIPIDIFNLILYVSYIWGFATLAEMYKKPVITYASYAWITASILSTIVVYAFPNITQQYLIQVLFGITIGSAIIAVGWQMTKLQNQVGILAQLYGILAMVIGIGVLGFFGDSIATIADLCAFALASTIFLQVARKN